MKDLTTMKVEELRTIAKELNIHSAWKMKKADLISEIEKAREVKALAEIEEIINEGECEMMNKQTVEVEVKESDLMSYEEFCQTLTPQVLLLAEPKEEAKEVEEVKPTRKPRVKEERHIVLYDAEGNMVQEFETKKDAVTYVVRENSLMNIGWFNCCLTQNRPAYYTIEGKRTFPKKEKYTGIGYTLQYK